MLCNCYATVYLSLQSGAESMRRPEPALDGLRMRPGLSAAAFCLSACVSTRCRLECSAKAQRYPGAHHLCISLAVYTKVCPEGAGHGLSSIINAKKRPSGHSCRAAFLTWTCFPSHLCMQISLSDPRSGILPCALTASLQLLPSQI